MENKKQELIKAMAELQKSMDKVSELWDQNFEFNEVLEAQYPFNESFDEVVEKTRTWTREATETLS